MLSVMKIIIETEVILSTNLTSSHVFGYFNLRSVNIDPLPIVSMALVGPLTSSSLSLYIAFLSWLGSCKVLRL